MAIELLESNKFLSIFDYAVVGNKLYFSNDTFNAYVEVDLTTKEVVRIEQFIGNPLNAMHLHTACIAYHNKVFFYSYRTTRIHVMDLMTGQQHMIPEIDAEKGFNEAVIHEDQLYFLPSCRQVMLHRYDEMSGMLQEVDWWTTDAEPGVVSYQKIKDKWVGFIISTRTYFLIDFEKKLLQKERSQNNIYRMVYENDNIWYISSEGQELYCISMPNYKEKKYTFSRCDSNGYKGSQYINIFVTDRGILLCSANIDGIYLLDRRSEKIERIADLSECDVDDWVWGGFDVRVRQEEEWLVYTFPKRNLILRIHARSLQVKYMKIGLEKKDLVRRYIAGCLYEERAILSESECSLEDFVMRF